MIFSGSDSDRRGIHGQKEPSQIFTSMMNRKRVVVTGLGVVAPNGIGKEAFWSSILAGKSGIKSIRSFDASEHPSRIGGEIQDFDPSHHIGRGINTKRLAFQTQLALAAAFQAVSDAALTEDMFSQKRSVPLILGVGSSAVEVIADSMAHLIKHGPRRMHVHSAHACHPHHATSVLAQYIPFISQATTTGSACTAGMDAIATAADLIRRGKANVAMCGATDSPVNSLTYAAMAAAGLLSFRNEAPEKACRPFDIDRDSGVVSDGAGILILESLDHALSRGRKPYLEITGYGTHVDTDPEQPGNGWEYSMRDAIANAGHHPTSVDYLCAHAPGHPLIDRIETEMIKKVFGAHAYRLPISSIKGIIGSPLSATGPMQVITCSLALRDGVIPSTTNLEKPDPACDLNYLPGKPYRIQPNVILVNSHGLGGGNSSLIVERLAI